MDCGIPFCHQGCPVNNQIPDWNNLVYRDQWRAALENAAFHQQFPGIHRPHLPRALRGVLHPQHPRQPGHHQDHRMPDRRPRLGRRLDPAGDRAEEDRQDAWRWWARVRRAWPAPSNWRAPAIRVTLFEKSDRIGGLLRYGIPDFKMEKHLIDRRIAPDGSRRRGLPHRRRGRRRHFGGHAAGRLRRGGAVGRRGSAARSAGRGPRARRHPFRHGFPHPAEQARGGRSAKTRPRPTAPSAPRASMWW